MCLQNHNDCANVLSETFRVTVTYKSVLTAASFTKILPKPCYFPSRYWSNKSMHREPFLLFTQFTNTMPSSGSEQIISVTLTKQLPNEPRVQFFLETFQELNSCLVTPLQLPKTLDGQVVAKETETRMVTEGEIILSSRGGCTKLPKTPLETGLNN